MFRPFRRKPKTTEAVAAVTEIASASADGLSTLWVLFELVELVGSIADN